MDRHPRHRHSAEFLSPEPSFRIALCHRATLTRAKSMTIAVIVFLVLIAALGVPLFVVLGAGSLVASYASGLDPAVLLIEMLRLTSSPNLIAIPLFTLAGVTLARGGAPQRLVQLFNTGFGWMPGGLAIVALMSCAFFTAFSGASGVTILALGGLLYPMLVGENYSKRFSLGLLTSSGSLGLLFPPSLAVLLYGIVAGVSIEQLFTAGLLGGYLTVTEAASCSAAYALLLESVIHRRLNTRALYHEIFRETCVLVGSLLIILGIALGLTNLMIDAQLPMKILAILEQDVQSQLQFLLLLNVFLLAIGCVMDIFSATMVIVPLILPLAQRFGVDPVHLGIIFLANLEIGYLTPPVGINLFLASQRFREPMLNLFRASLPFLLIMLIWLALVTYLPYLSLWWK